MVSSLLSISTINRKVFIFPGILSHVFLMAVILTGMRWNLNIGSLIANNVEHFKKCLLAVCVFSSDNALFSSTPPGFTFDWVICFLEFFVYSKQHFGYITSKDFLPFCRLPLHSIDDFLCYTKPSEFREIAIC